MVTYLPPGGIHLEGKRKGEIVFVDKCASVSTVQL